MYSVIEKGTHEDFKANLFKVTEDWPSVGFTYTLPGWDLPIIVHDFSRTMVHVVTEDLHTATSYYLDAWIYLANSGQIKRLDKPWVDMTDVRRSLSGS